jgi:hypothetical protein
MAHPTSDTANSLLVFSAYIKRLIWQERLSNWLGIIGMVLIIVLFAAAVQRLGFANTIILSAFPAGFICLLLVLRYRMFAIACGFVIMYTGPLITRLTGLPIPFGIINDLLVILMAISMFVSNADRSRFKFWNPVTVSLFIVLAYTTLQVLNPDLQSHEGYWIGFRKTLSFFLFQAVVLHEIQSFQRLKQLLVIILWMTLAVCLYGCYCEWFGLPGFEYQLLISNPKVMGLVFVDGKFRIFSSMSDPATFGILMAMAAIFCAGLMLGPFRTRTKIVLGIMIVLFALGASYSGTRTAYAVFFAGLAMLFLLNLHHRAAIPIMLAGGMLFSFILFAPIYSSPTLNRIRSVFHPSKDASMNVRDFNRKRAQPYMWSHPIGGGIGTTGELGEQTQPNHPLAGFPPDSGYVRTVLETGWIGLLIQCLSYLFIMMYAVWQMFHSQKKLTRALYAASIAVLFSGALGQIAQFSDNIFFLILMPITAQLRLLEKPV